MKLVFFGNTDFSNICLRKILQSSHQVLSVVTNPDKKKGRGQKFFQTPVKVTAAKNYIEIITADDLKNPNLVEKLSAKNADIFVVVAYRILPEDIFLIPKEGSINLHASYLPYYRGAAPVNWVLINGEKETGVSTFFLEKTVDTGNIISRQKVKIDPEDDFGTLLDKLAAKGSDLLLETLDKIENEKIKPIKQPKGNFPKAPKIHKEECGIDWSKNAEDIFNFVRGLSPYPCAFTSYQGKKIKIFKSEIVNNLESGNGEIEFADKKNGIIVKCGAGKIKILELQLEGKKRLNFTDFLNGFKLRTGEKLK